MHQSFYEMYSSNPLDYNERSYSAGETYYTNINSSPLLLNQNNSFHQNTYSPNNGYRIEIAKGLKLSKVKDEEINESENINHIPKENEKINSPAIFYNKNLNQVMNSNDSIINARKVINSIADQFLTKIPNKKQENDEKNITTSNFNTKNEIIIDNKKNNAINTLKNKLSFLEQENLELKNNLKQITTPKKSKETIENLLQENQKWNSLLIEKISENAQLQKKIIEISDSKKLNEKISKLETINSNLLKQIKIKKLINLNPNIEKYEKYNRELEQKSNELDEKIKLNEISLCAEKLQNRGDRKLMNLIIEKSSEIEKIFKKINF